jgi:fimbrial isopeptide formation D2 family protein
MESRASTATRLSVLPVLIALLMNLLIGPLAPIISGSAQTLVRADDVEIIQDTTINGCNGVVSTPGSENTDKRLTSGSLEPGGTATFEITYPVDPEDVAGREEFEITDCVFIEDVAVAKYFIHFVPNTENFVLTFTLNIPANAPVGDEYCNYAKTTAAPSQSQASNRKAGPACFLIGGDLLINKTDAAGNPLPGADFSINCTWPTTTAALAGTVITASPDGSVSDGNDANGTNDSSEAFTSSSGGTLSKSATTGSNGTIAVAAPVGTSCTFTETDPPAGYEADPNDLSETLVVTSGQQQTHTFVNTVPPAHLTIVKTLDGEVPATNWAYSGTSPIGNFSLPAAGGSTDPYELEPGSYTITETTKDGYDVTVSCTGGETGTSSVSVDLAADEDVTCTFANVAQPGSITVIKSLDGDAPAAAWAYTGDLGSFNLAASGGQTTFSNLDAGTYDFAETTKDGFQVSVSCDSGESGASSVSVDLDPGEAVICTFVNVADTSVTIDKSNDAEVEGDPGTVSRGDTVHFVIEVNIDGNDATNVVVTDEIPDGLTYVAASADPATTSVAGQLLTWDMGDLAQGQYFFEYDATVDEDASGTLTNVGCIDTDELNEELCDDSSVLVEQPTVEIVKTNNAEGAVTRGSTVHYSLTVTVSDGPAHDVMVTDELPAGINYKTDTADPSAGFSLSLDGRTLTWDAGTLSTGTHTFEYDGLVANDAPIGSDITNTGCVAASDDATDDPICDTSTVTVTPPTLQIDKENNFEGEAVVRGQTIDYRITVEVMDGPMQNAVITDTLPDGLTYVADSGSPEPTSVAGNVITWNVGELATGEHTFIYQATVDEDASGTLTNLACVDADELDAALCDQTDVDVTPPTVKIDKVNNAEGAVTRGSTVHYTLTVSVEDGPAHDVVVTDDLPAGITYKTDTADPSAGFSLSSDGRTLTWDAGTLATGNHEFEYDGLVDNDAPINSDITNVGCVAASDDANDGTICEDSTVTVTPPTLEITKSNEFEGETVLRGETIDYSVTVEVMDGPMHDAVITDTLPDGLTYKAGSGSPAPTSVAGNVITWEIDELATGEYTFSYQATVDADATGSLTNLACVDTNELDDELCDQTTTTVRIPILLIDKAANVESITISGPNNALVATPAVVTWTLSYTLTSGPVTNAVITDTIPTGFTFLDASNGGAPSGNTVTWNLGTLTSSGSVTFRTTVNPATISRVGPTVNIATIVSSETAPDQGQDSVTVAVIPPPLAGNPTPKPVLPNTATGFGPDGTPVTVPIELLAVFFIGSLGALALANARARSHRR